MDHKLSIWSALAKTQPPFCRFCIILLTNLTNQQTDTGENMSSLAEIITMKSLYIKKFAKGIKNVKPKVYSFWSLF